MQGSFHFTLQNGILRTAWHHMHHKYRITLCRGAKRHPPCYLGPWQENTSLKWDYACKKFGNLCTMDLIHSCWGQQETLHGLNWGQCQALNIVVYTGRANSPTFIYRHLIVLFLTFSSLLFHKEKGLKPRVRKWHKIKVLWFLLTTLVSTSMFSLNWKSQWYFISPISFVTLYIV